MNLASILTMASPFFRDIYHSQIQHFQQTLIRRKHGFGFCGLSELAVKSLDDIRSIDQAADRFRIFEISRKIHPVVLPRFCDFRIFPLHFSSKLSNSASAFSSVAAAYTRLRSAIRGLSSL